MTPRSEQETIIAYDRELDEWHYYSNVPKHNHKWGCLIEETSIATDKSGNVISLEGIIRGNVIVAKKRVMSEENKAKSAERLKALRELKSK